LIFVGERPGEKAYSTCNTMRWVYWSPASTNMQSSACATWPGTPPDVSRFLISSVAAVRGRRSGGELTRSLRSFGSLRRRTFETLGIPDLLASCEERDARAPIGRRPKALLVRGQDRYRRTQQAEISESALVLTSETSAFVSMPTVYFPLMARACSIHFS
jgi:hypothetical protein